MGAIALAACSSGSTSSGGTAGDATETVTWGADSVTMIDAIAFTGMGIGAFQKYHLNAEFVNGTTAPTTLETGGADIVRTDFSTGPLLTKEGKGVKIFATVAVNTPVGLLGTNSVKSIADLKAMGSNCILASFTNGDFYTYPNYWSKKFGLRCKIDQVSDYGLAISGVAAGRYTAAPELASNAGSAIAAKQAHWLISPGSDRLPFDVISSVYMTTSSYLSSHKSEVQNFVKALEYTETKMKTMSNQQIAAAIKKSGATIWTSESASDIVEQLTGDGQASNVFSLDKVNIGPLSQTLYNANLHAQPEENIPVDPGSSEFSYAALVNNSFVG
jgi:hypothetical protein